MWRRERVGAEVLRIGRHAVERWASHEDGLSRIAAQALPQDEPPQVRALVAAMSALYSSPAAPVTVVIESAWLPVACVDTGTALLRASQVDALARYRFAMYESELSDPLSRWELRIEHRAGDRHALAYGLPPTLKQTLTTTAASLDVQLHALTPAFAWGRDRLRPGKSWSRSPGWWLWPEQDRMLVARFAASQTLGLNAGASLVTGELEALRLVDAERARWGIDAPGEPVAAARWAATLPTARKAGVIDWSDLCSPTTTPAILAFETKAAA